MAEFSARRTRNPTVPGSGPALASFLSVTYMRQKKDLLAKT